MHGRALAATELRSTRSHKGYGSLCLRTSTRLGEKSVYHTGKGTRRADAKQLALLSASDYEGN